MTEKSPEKLKRILDSSEEGFTTLKEKIGFVESLFKAGIISATELKTAESSLRKTAASNSMSGEVELVNLDLVKRKCWFCGKDTMQKTKYVYAKIGRDATLVRIAGGIAGGILGGAIAAAAYSIRVDSRNRVKRHFSPQKNLYLYECQSCKFSFPVPQEEEAEIDMMVKRGLRGFNGKEKESENIRLIT